MQHAAAHRSRSCRPAYVAVCLLGIASAAFGAPTAKRVGPAADDAASVSATTRNDCDIEDGVLVHGSRRYHSIALTFDACPTTHVPAFSSEIVDELAREGVPATFFVSGRWAQAHPHELARLESVPFFEIALHGHHHRRLTSPDAIRAEIEDGRQALEDLGGKPQMLFRPPFGDHPQALGPTARRAGVTPVLWDVAPGDPDPRERAADITRDVLRRAHGGSIVVLHVNGRGVGTAAALPALLSGLRQRGYQLVTVSDLIRECGLLADP